MKVVIFGATGQTGRLLTKRALSHGDEVTAFVRDPARLSNRGGLMRVIQGDVLDMVSVEPAVAGQQAILVALGTATKGSPPVLPQGIRHVLDAMERHGVRRIVALTAAGALHESAETIGARLGMKLARAMIPRVYAEHRGMLEEIRMRDLDWTAVRPVLLTNGPWTGRYRVVEEGIPRGGYRISREDVADFMIRQLTNNDFVRKMPAIAS